jgi:hypothetical protein
MRVDEHLGCPLDKFSAVSEAEVAQGGFDAGCGENRG